MTVVDACRLFCLAGLLLAGVPVWAQEPGEAARGMYLVRAMGCGDCHTPMKMGPNGPVPDAARGLSGHPQGLAMPPPPSSRGPWIGALSATNTAFAGPWGISYSANLTPDVATGMGSWKVGNFIDAMRLGKSRGGGRPIKPPMPWPAIGQLNDADLKAIFAYLMSQPAVVNAVPGL